MDRWLARVALMLSLTKSVADAADFAPLKGACEAVITILDSVQAVKDNQYALYTTVLQTAFPNPKPTLLEDMRTILGVLAVAKETLDMKTLTDLLVMDPWTVEYICSALRPVLEFDGGLRFRHQSFVDFF
ncbi:SubName: Full=Related to WD40-repeat protein (Notchless protein) {ECO:0000313/EMBL:CCA74855.1} [Serendipita indica DSM 11827]|nr:SubName: Full=Related to WD40-repeat protein (Notchless protein) {ECO:0000313/EMBL:CCA74855.1} [Serendipita indica DSM 11827]